MKILPKILIGLASLPLVAHADLTLTNATDQYASAMVAETQICAGSMGGILKPGESFNLASDYVALGCGFQAPCTAQLYVSNSRDEAANCRGTLVAAAQIDDLDSNLIAKLKVYDSRYQFSGLGTNHGTMSKAK